jgi:predicted nucleic acid-binding protein
VLCRQTQLSLLRLLTTRQILQEQVCTMAQAWSLYRLLLSDSRFVFSSEPSTFDIVFHQTSNLEQVSPKLWQDTYLAAFAISGNYSLVTFDQAFRQYYGLSVDILH